MGNRERSAFSGAEKVTPDRKEAKNNERGGEKMSKKHLMAFVLAVTVGMGVVYDGFRKRMIEFHRQDLDTFAKEYPDAERLDKQQVDTIIKTINDFDESVEGGGSRFVQFNSSSSIWEPTDAAILKDKDTVVFFRRDPEQDKLNDQSSNPVVISHETVYKLVKDSYGNYLVIMQGNSFDSTFVGKENGGRPIRAAEVDIATGIITSVKNYVPSTEASIDWTTEDHKSYELSPNAETGNLKPSERPVYKKGLGRRMAYGAVSDMDKLSAELEKRKEFERFKNRR